MLDIGETRKCLDHIKQIKLDHPLIDVHVHPFEVIFNGLDYQRNPLAENLYSSQQTDYVSPEIRESRLSSVSPASCHRLINENMRNKFLMLTGRKIYQHTGPPVFADHMRLSNIDRVLLLPVSHPDTSIDRQMELMSTMFGDDPSFEMGYSVSAGTTKQQISDAITGAVNAYNIRAVKVHPAITGVNFSNPDGQEYIESILLACQYHRLSIIIHGGKSPDVTTVGTRNFGDLVYFEHINWGLAENPVVIAHAGLYGYDQETSEPAMKRLRCILNKYDNVMVDLSGLGHASLCRLLNDIPSDRIVFGSDALYYPQWRTAASLYHAISNALPHPDDHFIKIASTNPQRIISSKEVCCVKGLKSENSSAVLRR